DTVLVTACVRPLNLSQATPASTNGRATGALNRYFATSGNSQAPVEVELITVVMPLYPKCRYSASTSTASPKGSRNSAVGPMMYRFVVALKLKFWLRVASRKSFIGTPPLIPNPNGCADAAPAKSKNTHRDLILPVTKR